MKYLQNILDATSLLKHFDTEYKYQLRDSVTFYQHKWCNIKFFSGTIMGFTRCLFTGKLGYVVDCPQKVNVFYISEEHIISHESVS